MNDPYLSPDIEATIMQCVTDCTWLVRRRYPSLAVIMRDEFCKEWEVEEELWNEKVDTLIDYVQRKGETPEISTAQLMAVRYGTEQHE